VPNHDIETDAPDMTITQAPFVQHEKQEGHIFIRQPYELYTEANQLDGEAAA
jgi:hypothetical protein